LEDPRISRMYLAMIGRGFERALGRFGIAIHEKGRGKLTQLKTHLGSPAHPGPVQGPQPGGQDPIILTREQQTAALSPEFLSATLLPGRGMNVLQITAYLPGKGEVPLLQSPSLVDAATAMSGIEADVNGEASLAVGGAIEVPWAGQISGASLPGGTSVLANWHGRGVTLPVNSSVNGTSSVGGLLLRRGADSAKQSSITDGGLAEATFNADDFDGHWPSRTEVKTTVLLGAHAIDITVVAHNVGTRAHGYRMASAFPASERKTCTGYPPPTLEHPD